MGGAMRSATAARRGCVPDIRTVLVALPKLLGEVVVTTLFHGHVPVAVVARLDSLFAIRAQLPVLAPDLVLMALRSGEADEVAATVLSLVPGATVIALSYGGRNAHVHDMGLPRLDLPDVSSTELIDVVLQRRLRGWRPAGDISSAARGSMSNK
jgi:hypothetical protein